MSLFNKYTSSRFYTKTNSIWNKIVNNRLYRTLLGVFTGAVIGFVYYKFVGCSSGSCGLTSNPYGTTLMFGLLGGLFASDKKKNTEVVENKKEQV